MQSIAVIGGGITGVTTAYALAKRGFVSYTARSADGAQSGAAIEAQARVFFDDAPPIEYAAELIRSLHSQGVGLALGVSAYAWLPGGAGSSSRAAGPATMKWVGRGSCCGHSISRRGVRGDCALPALYRAPP